MIDPSGTVNGGAFWEGDMPAEGVTIELDQPAENYNRISPRYDGDHLPPIPYNGETTIVVPWPTVPFAAGSHILALVAQDIDEDDNITAVLQLGAIRVLVMADDGWHTLDSARAAWVDAPSNDTTLWDYLTTAKEQVLTFGVSLAADAPIPDRFKVAQLMQAKALYQKNRSNPDDNLNTGSYGVTIYPMDKTVRTVIRPKSGVPWALGAPRA